MAEKPDDRWALPLNRSCHLRQHAFGSERDWWCGHGIDPFSLAIEYYGEYDHHYQRPNSRRLESKKPKRKAKIAARKNPWPKRKFR